MTTTEQPRTIEVRNDLLEAPAEHEAAAPGRWRRRLVAIAVLLVAAVVAVIVAAEAFDGSRTSEAPVILDPRTEQVPSGSPFDTSPARPSDIEQVPSGSPFDAPLQIVPPTDRVPSGSPFDAPQGASTADPTAALPLTGTSVDSLVDAERSASGLVPFEPGDYVTDQLPRQVGFTAGESLGLFDARAGYVGLGPLDQPADGFQLLALTEPSRFIDPASVATGTFLVSYVDFPEDVGAWLEAVPAVVVTGGGEGTVAGSPAKWWQIGLAPDIQGNGACHDPCVALWEAGANDRWLLAAGAVQRIWQVDGESMLVVIEASTPHFDQWASSAEQLLDSIELGGPTGTSAGDLTDPTVGDHEVGWTAVTVVDPSRPTDEVAVDGAIVVAGEDQRVLDVAVAYPAATRGREVEPAPGPFPLVVVAHGLGGTGAIGGLEQALVTDGMIVAAVRFPESSTPGLSVADYLEQPADVSFVLDQLLGAGVLPLLDGRIDAQRIGVMGYSLGGATVYGLIGASCCTDERIAAAVSHGGIVLGFGTNEWQNPPTLVIGGQADTTTRIQTLRDLVPELAAPAYLLELAEAGHLTWSNPTDPNFAPTIELLRAFFEVHLGGDDPAALDAAATAFDAEWTARN